MAPSAGASDGRDVMANIAARLMGRAPTSTKPVAEHPKTTIPISVPKFSNTKATASHKSNENIAPTTETSRAKRPAPQGEDINMTDESGPSLFGTADQLAAAREFARSATVGRSKSRNSSYADHSDSRPLSRVGRQRLFTKDSGRGSISTTSSSPRSSPVKPASGLAHSQVFRAAEVKNSGLSSVHERPTVPLIPAAEPTPAPTRAPTPAASPFQITPDGLTAGGNTFPKPSAVNGTLKPVDSFQPTHAHPSSPPPKKSKNETTKMRPAWQLADVTNVLKERASNATVPPHLRSKAAAAGIPERQTSATPAGTSDEMVIDEPDWKQPTTNGVQNPVVEVKPEPKIKPEMLQHTQNSINEQAPTSTGTNDILHALKKVKDQLEEVSLRLTTLEQSNWGMEKDLQLLKQAEERRKFLGTDNAKAPFGLDIKCPNGKSYNVQVNAELKVYELVRRIRTKANLAPAATTNPRVIIGTEAVGHGMTLGEVGISKEMGNVSVKFSYDEA